jgi:hypothetical protein
MPFKRCAHCQIEKPLDNFQANKDAKDKKHSWCKKCVADFKKTDKYKAKQKIYGTIYQQIWHLGATKESVEHFRGECINQDNRCCICNKRQRVLCYDHDHKNGKYRGAICKLCNQGLGSFKDDIEVMSNAIEYLRKTMILEEV